MRHACHKPRDQGARGRQGEEGKGEVPCCSAVCKQGGYSEDGDKETEGQGPRGLGKWAREGEGERTHEGQGVRFSCNLYSRFFQCKILTYVHPQKTTIPALFWTVLVSVDQEFL